MTARNSLEQHIQNTSPGPYFEPEQRGFPENTPPPVRLIAYYLPQFHAIPENDAWWEPGFTEWTNVTKAVPRFHGHYQPRLPADLGFYDLANPAVLQAQTMLARHYGIEGFCFHYYWFSPTKPLLDGPIKLLLKNPEIQLPFCINWANESWSRTWTSEPRSILIEQEYPPGFEAAFADAIAPLLHDPRYIRVDGRPLLMIYRPSLFPDARASIERLRACLRVQGIGDTLILMSPHNADLDHARYGLDGIAGFPPHPTGWGLRKIEDIRWFDHGFRGRVCSYRDLAMATIRSYAATPGLFPGVCPSWDNEPRKPAAGVCFAGATPRAYGVWLEHAGRHVIHSRPPDERIVFINAWNEWAEGAHLEPDRHFGHAYLAETSRTLQRLGDATAESPGIPTDDPPLEERWVNRLQHQVVSVRRRARRAALRPLSALRV